MSCPCCSVMGLLVFVPGLFLWGHILLLPCLIIFHHSPRVSKCSPVSPAPMPAQGCLSSHTSDLANMWNAHPPPPSLRNPGVNSPPPHPPISPGTLRALGLGLRTPSLLRVACGFNPQVCLLFICQHQVPKAPGQSWGSPRREDRYHHPGGLRAVAPKAEKAPTPTLLDPGQPCHWVSSDFCPRETAQPTEGGAQRSASGQGKGQAPSNRFLF